MISYKEADLSGIRLHFIIKMILITKLPKANASGV